LEAVNPASGIKKQANAPIKYDRFHIPHLQLPYVRVTVGKHNNIETTRLAPPIG
jgi:hypothetical protein